MLVKLNDCCSTLNCLFNVLATQSLFEGQSASWDVAKKEQNRTKNRYGNIIACKKASLSHTCSLEKKSITAVFAVWLHRNVAPFSLSTSVQPCQIPHIILLPVTLLATAFETKGLSVNVFSFSLIK